MARPNLAQLVAEAWQWECENAPCHNGEWLYYQLTREPLPSYRERLDRQPRNCYGELIPRIRTVQYNLIRLGNIRLDPKRLV